VSRAFVESGYFEIVGAAERAGRWSWLVTSTAELGLVVGRGFGAALAAGGAPEGSS
jgi:hypothetical protein